MVPPFDIFRNEDDGQARWIGAAATTEDAERVVRAEMRFRPASYTIASMRTGTARVIEPPPD